MYKTQLEQATEVVRVFLSDSERQDLHKKQADVEKFLDDAKTVKLPLLGVFNAGKTTLVNSILADEGMLPVNIVPETSIPCEIYPVKDGEAPHAEIFRDSQMLFSGQISDYGSVKVEPGDYGKVFTSSPAIEKWHKRGIVLVDMPGFDSGIEEHNRAITRYMSQGAVFAFLMNAANGSLKASEISLLKEVCQYGIKIGVFLTHSDKLSEEKLNEVKEYVEYQTTSFLPAGTPLGVLSVIKGDNKSFLDFVDSLDVTQIVEEKTKPVVKNFIASQIAVLRGLVALAGSNAHPDELEAKINEVKKQIHDLEKGLEQGLANADTPEKSTQDILDITRKALKDNAPLIADAILETRGEGGFSAVVETIVAIIRPALAEAFKIEQQQYISALNAEISSLTRHILEGIEIPTDVLADIISDNQSAIVGYIQMIADMLMNSDNAIAKVIGQILSYCSEYIVEFIKDLFGNSEKTRKKLIEQIEGPVTSSILKGLRAPVMEQVRAQQFHIIQTMRAQYEANLNNMQEMLARLYKEQTEGAANIAATISKYNDAIAKLEVINNGI